MKILIPGSGLLGVVTAYVLASRGHAVEVIERKSEAGAETSFANGGQLSYSYGEPWATPGVLGKLPFWLAQKNSPLVWHPSADPDMIRWGLEFLSNCTPSRAERNTINILRLGLYSRVKMHEIMRQAALAFDHAPAGILQVFTKSADLKAAIRQMEFQAKFGCEQEVLNADEVLAREPVLRMSGRRYIGGVLSPRDEVADAQKFCIGLAAHCVERLGVVFHYNTEIKAIAAEAGRIAAVMTEKGEHEAGAYVMALGSYCPLFLKGLNIRVPVIPMKGYSLTFAAGEHAPRGSITDGTYKIVFTRLGDRIRVAGTAEFAGYDDGVSAARIAAIAANGRKTMPMLDWDNPLHAWGCLRASTPSGVPILGPTPLANLFLNTGHGTLGWTQGAGSAYIVADFMENRVPEITTGGLTLGGM